MFIKELLLEGGNVFPGTKPIAKSEAAGILTTLQLAMPPGIKLHKVGSAGHKDFSGDMDVMVDEKSIISMFKNEVRREQNAAQNKAKKVSPAQIARSCLKDYFMKRGFAAAQSGVNVHVKVPNGKNFAQVDIMLVDDADNMRVFHQHDYHSEFKGLHKQQLLSSIAKETKTKK